MKGVSFPSEIIVPELEEKISAHLKKTESIWKDPKNLDILKKYYGIIQTKDLADYLGVRQKTITNKAAEIGLKVEEQRAKYLTQQKEKEQQSRPTSKKGKGGMET